MSERLGLTGRFPHGKIRKDDDGELKFQVGIHEGLIIMDFGRPATWIAFDVKMAKNLINILSEKISLIGHLS